MHACSFHSVPNPPPGSITVGQPVPEGNDGNEGEYGEHDAQL